MKICHLKKRSTTWMYCLLILISKHENYMEQIEMWRKCEYETLPMLLIHITKENSADTKVASNNYNIV